jgi:hypothetical protein
VSLQRMDADTQTLAGVARLLHSAADLNAWARGCYATEAARGILIRTGEESDQAGRETIMESPMATTAEQADMLGVGRSRGYRPLAALALELIKIGRSLRVPVALIRHVANSSSAMEVVEASTEGSSESATPEQEEAAGNVRSA